MFALRRAPALLGMAGLLVSGLASGLAAGPARAGGGDGDLDGRATIAVSAGNSFVIDNAGDIRGAG